MVEMGGDILKDFISGVLVVAISIAILAGLGYLAGKKQGYKQGQIDAQTGKVTWQLQTLEDSTKVWRNLP